MFKTPKLACAAVLLGGLMTVGGCANNDEITANDVQWDWSPELYSTARSHEQYETMKARAIDTNLRQLAEDHARLWFVDEPLHLSRYPVP